MKLFMKGFNHGYILAMELPHLLSMYLNIGNHRTEYGVGFRKGADLGQKRRIERDLKKKRNKGKGGFEFGI